MTEAESEALRKYKKPRSFRSAWGGSGHLAERGGFEPPVDR